MRRTKDFMDELPVDLKRLRALIAYKGDRAAVAELLGIQRTTINQWFTTRARIPAKYFSPLAKMSDGLFQVQDFIRE